jgi:REP element-mobilizing transposase RayT
MPQFDSLDRRYNTLRLLGYDYNSTWQLCAVTLVTDLRRPLFADVMMSKSVLRCLLSDQTFEYLRLRAFTLLPDHLHLIAGVREAEKKLQNLIGCFKSFTTQEYWKRACEVVQTGHLSLPSTSVSKSTLAESRPLISASFEWRATLRPEVVELENWPNVRPEHFRPKRLWQRGLFDHVIRNDYDLQENLDYIAMNAVRRGYVTHPQFYPYTGFLFPPCFDVDAGVATEGHPYS